MPRPSLSKKDAEEVNSWRSYDQVGSFARALPTTRRRSNNSRGGRTLHRQNETLSSLLSHRSANNVMLDDDDDNEYDVELYGMSSGHKKRRSSAYELALSSMYNKKNKQALIHQIIDDNKAAALQEETPEEQQESEDDEEEDLPTAVVVLSDEVKANIRHIFCVYFEGCHDHHDDDAQPAVTENKTKKKKTCMCWSLLSSMQMLNGTMPWLSDYIIKHTIPGSSSSSSSSSCFGCSVLQTALLFTQTCLRGASQVYFLNNPMSGLLIVAAMLVQSTRVAVYGLIALMSGNLSAYMLGFHRDLIDSGLFGYNSFLVGLALATFDTSTTTTKHSGYSAGIFIWTIILSCFSSIVFVSLGKLLVPYKSPPLTFPFNIATLMFLIATAEMSARVASSIGPVNDPALLDYHSNSSTAGQQGQTSTLTAQMFFAGVIRGIGQVFLADNFVSGLLVLAGMAICSRIAALAALVGSALGTAFAVALGAHLHGDAAHGIESGMYGFNSSLSVTAMFMFYVPSFGASLLAILASFLTIVAQKSLAGLLLPYGLPFMTLPFCIITIVFLFLQGTTSIVISVPLASMTIPEDHLRRVEMLADGYQFLKDSIINNDERDKTKYGTQISKTLRQLSCHLSPSEVTALTGKTSWSSWWEAPLSFIRAYYINCAEKMNARRDDKKTEWIECAAIDIFTALLESDENQRGGMIRLQQFTNALGASGLTGESGLKFAKLVFELMTTGGGDDVEAAGRMHSSHSCMMDRRDFIAFALVSRTLVDIHRKISQFVVFVDVNNDGYIDMEELQMAQEYLGTQALTDQERNELVRALNGQECRSNDHYGEKKDDECSSSCFDVVELVNFVTVSYLKTLVAEYHGKPDRTVSTTRSL